MSSRVPGQAPATDQTLVDGGPVSSPAPALAQTLSPSPGEGRRTLVSAQRLAGSGAWTAGTLVSGRYRLLQTLGRGGMGDVLLADDLFLRRKVAIKTLHKDMAADPQAAECFRAEVAMAHTLSHPGLARTYDYASYVMDDDPTVIAVAPQLKGMADSNGYDVASFILAFVQSLDYSNDPNGREYPRYPAETLVDGGGDCEDTAALFASLVQCSAVNIDAVLLMYDYPDQNGHMAAGIAGAYSGHTERDQNGQEYYYCETTGEHFAVGQFPADFPPGYTVTVLQC